MSSDPCGAGVSRWPAFDFRSLSLSQAARQQLSTIFRYNRSGAGPARNSQLNLLRQNGFDTQTGTYVPVGDRVEIPGKLPVQSDLFARKLLSFSTEPLPVSFFSNALVIPEGFGEPDFVPEAALPPRERLTNCGHLVATMEFDPVTRDQFEEMLSWTRGAGGKFTSSRFSNVDRALCRSSEYRGYAIVYSGRTSLHFHFVFSTAHLKAARHDSSADDRRLRCEEVSAVMHNVHDRYWDRVSEVFVDEIKPSFRPDHKMRNATQWRRIGGGVRLVDKTTSFLGLEVGMRVPQLIIHENVRERAPRSAEGFLVSPDIALSNPPPRRPRAPSTPLPLSSACDEVIMLLQDLCSCEWGREYPKPVAVGQQNGDVVLRFRNHPEDRNPSTVCVGSNRKLLLHGNHEFKGDFYLPDNMTADELLRHVQRRCGLLSAPGEPTLLPGSNPPEFQLKKPAGSFKELRERSREFRDPLTDHIAEPLRGVIQDGDDRGTRIKNLREVLPDVVERLRRFSGNYLLQLPEGVAKSTAHFAILQGEALYTAIEKGAIGFQSFTAFASRSVKQASEKAKEYEELTGGNAVVITPLRRAYEQECDRAGERPIPESKFRDGSLSGRLQKIKHQQPSVYAALEEFRQILWSKGSVNLFDCSRTILFMTHSMAQNWAQSRTTRLWLHPSYDPEQSDEEAEALRSTFTLSKVTYDELEVDGFVHLLREDLFGLIEREQRKYGSWRDLPRHERLDAFVSLRTANAIPGRPLSFDDFDSLMRLNLERLTRVEVNFEAIPFGYDRKPNGLYTRSNGVEFYVGEQAWISSKKIGWGFLTTESLTSRVVERVHGRVGRQHFPFSISTVPAIHPIKVPLVIDPRAGADQGNKEKVTALATAICDANPNAIVIADGVKGIDRVLTFQSAKGRNGLEDKDVYIILTNLAPAKYEELNVLGQWLDTPDIIPMYYQDQINQAVGRNRGFRQSTNGETRTVVVAAKRFYDSVIGHLDPNSRVQLYLCDQKHW